MTKNQEKPQYQAQYQTQGAEFHIMGQKQSGLDVLNIGTRYSRHCVEYWIQGPESEVIDWGERLKNNYHPAGYGTSVKISAPNENGIIWARAWHGRSCD